MNNETNHAYRNLIDKIKKIQREKSLSLTQISRESGCPKSTISQFLNSQYCGNNEKIAELLRRWIETHIARYQASKQMKKAPDFLMLSSSASWLQVFEYAQLASDIGVVTGAPGTSKTLTAEYYCKTNSNAWLITADSSLRSPRALLQEIAEVVDCPVKTGSRLMRELVKRLKDTGGLLIIDEAQHLTTEALDQLRALNDQAGIGLAWIGNEPLRGRIEGMGQQAANAQIFSRVGMWKSRSQPSHKDIDQLVTAWGVSNPEIEKLLRWIGSREGGLRELNKTLKFAFYIAGTIGRDELDIADIEAGWNQRKPSMLRRSAGLGV